ncbi:site-specific recombinase [Methanosarcina siciliae HI350]|uniref:Site-specific recombinase n=1 Tax=Methanosarcina siciliae HI350 TaxID=1434119 RepID=A0A0E3PH95_9EURY|nr:site-specific integrase [Methanosarcina siciliae]AKB34158.1 site-specific recombinase [Methanosarcina siciliae HI350]
MSSEILSSFSLDCSCRGFSSRTVDNYVSCIRYFLELHSIDSDYDDLKKFLVHIRDEKKYSASTCNGYFSSLNTFYDYLVFEGKIDKNLVPSFRKRYMRTYKKFYESESRKLISIGDMALLVDEPDELVYRTIILFLAKTGLRRNELITLDREDLDLDGLTVYLKPTAKRSNRTVFFDIETKAFLEAYLSERSGNEKALFVGLQNGRRINRNVIYNVITRSALKIGLHVPGGHLDQKFTTHCTRHWFTTWLRRAGMERNFIKKLRGDSLGESIDRYDHIELDELKASYLRYIPQLGVKP